MNKPKRGTINTLEELLAVIKTAPNRKALAATPVRLLSRMASNRRSLTGESLSKVVELQDGSERYLNSLLRTLFPDPKRPSAVVLKGQDYTAETTLLACQLNLKNSSRPYDLTDIKLVSAGVTVQRHRYSVYCGIRDSWSIPTAAGNLRYNHVPRFAFNTKPHWDARDYVKSIGGVLKFTGELRGSTERAYYTCEHGVSSSVWLHPLALGNRPVSNCPTCHDIAFAEAHVNKTGSINPTTNLYLSSRAPKYPKGLLYVIHATHTSTGTPFIKVGYSVNGPNRRYGKRLERSLSNIKTRSFSFDEITARCLESLCHSVLQEHRVSLGANDLPTGFSTETYNPDCLPLLKSTLTYLRGLPMPDLITHPLAIDGISNMTPTRHRKLRKLSDSKTRRRSGVWSDYSYHPDPPRPSDDAWYALLNKTN